MPRFCHLLLLLCAILAFAQGPAPQLHQVKHTKFQRRAAGFWRTTEVRNDATVKWIVLYFGDTQDTMILRRPTGLGCANEEGEIKNDKITVLGNNFPAVIQITGAKTAILSMFGGQNTVHLKKTKESTDFLCE